MFPIFRPGQNHVLKKIRGCQPPKIFRSRGKIIRDLVIQFKGKNIQIITEVNEKNK